MEICRQHGDLSLSYAAGLGGKFVGGSRNVNNETTGHGHRDAMRCDDLELDILVGRYRKGRSTRVGGMAFGKGVRPIHGSQGFSLHWRGCWRWGGK